MEQKNQNTHNLLENKMPRRKFLELAAAAGAGALLESKLDLTGKVGDKVSDGADRIRRIFDKPEREATHEEVLPVLFDEVIKTLATPEGQELFGVSASDEEWVFAREHIENDTKEYGPHGEGSIYFGINDSEDDLTERLYYSQMFSVKNLIEVWAVRDKESGVITERGVHFGLPEKITDEPDVIGAMEAYLTIPDEAIGRATYDLTWRNVQGMRMLENYELSCWDGDDVNHNVSAFGDFMKYTTKKREIL